MISSGAKRDMLVVYFARSLLLISLDVEGYEEINNRSRDNTNKSLNQRIDRRIKKLIETLDGVNDSFNPQDGLEIARWLKKKLPAKVAPLLAKIKNLEIGLEALGLYLIYSNFEGRTNLMAEFKPMLDFEKLFSITDLLEEFPEDQTAEMFKLSDYCIKELKS